MAVDSHVRYSALKRLTPLISNFKTSLTSALNRSGFDDWHPKFDIRHLDRPRTRPKHLAGEGRIAAVMLLVFPDSRPDSMDPTEMRLILTRRRADLAAHPGQISLPGGRRESGESLERTARRETGEEIGVPPDSIDVLARLNQVYIPPSDFTVTPFVGWIGSRPRFIAEEAEVAEIIEVSLAELCDPAALQWGDIEVDERNLHVPFYAIQGHQVWGATAIMLSEFIERLSDL